MVSVVTGIPRARVASAAILSIFGLLLQCANAQKTPPEVDEKTAPVGASPADQSDPRIAAERGDAAAQIKLGLIYLHGVGEPHYQEALKWFRLAAEQGEPYAQYQLGSLYADGTGVHQDDVEAAKWFRLAAKQNEASAQLALGFAHIEGRGVPRDDAEALKWYRLAAEQGAAAAQYSIGLLYTEEDVR